MGAAASFHLLDGHETYAAWLTRWGCSAGLFVHISAAIAQCTANRESNARASEHGVSPCHPCRSGTTGTPKGVMATHRNYVSGIAGARNLLVQVRLLRLLYLQQQPYWLVSTRIWLQVFGVQ